RGPIAIAYLLARAADSVADSAPQKNASKLSWLQSFQKLLTRFETTAIQQLQQQGLQLIENEQEIRLLQMLARVFEEYFKLSEQERALVKQVVTTLSNGMLMDLEVFSDTSQITALGNAADLDQYTYLVAGCVGEFWTRVLDLHYGEQLQWPAAKQIEQGVRYGKALQMTNILRDVWKDAALGRCYLPQSDLAQNDLNTKNYLLAENTCALQQIIEKNLQNCLAHFEAAQAYYEAIPKRFVRLRIAALWPYIIGVKTLVLVKNNYSANHNVKIKRKAVYRLMLITPVLLLSNKLTQAYARQILRQC
ncbi:MAG: squalene/phytoene synthase family protein, partial [Gammaproteobacteria bacterium]|nr:squalene/phytoene synthase family protein [Gammaproteobacteria bacterium]